ncbi:YeaH/YhbH family protein [Rhodomicrobium sp. Az07]|uniref:YeaH/YhbH family protein n=1 Tax=Rhodomicrobium sp. Az07 TaxID=2839034 RepID=UPI001BEB67BB|nr:YeaH/YhbH family protein [Rhodomicrobium sp. Az07]
MYIIDRRRDASGKSLGNRQRFIRRARALVRHAVREASKDRKITDTGKGGEIVVPVDGVHEPSLRRSSKGGTREYLLPGNKSYIEGDAIERPPSGGGKGGASADGNGEDEFRFALSDEEFIDLFLEDLELPDLAKRQVMGEGKEQPRRAGYRSSGPPSSLSIQQTMRKSLARRIALRRPKVEEIADLEAQLKALEEEGGHEDKILEIREALKKQAKRSIAIPFIDPVDVRYRRFEMEPKPVAQAVMFCLMDVSGSMDEHLKDLAKRFYSLLYLFLSRRYRYVEVVFIRHTHEAKEVDEDTFFHSRETGGTVVSTALEEMIKVMHDRYPPGVWNIYAAQASDGDNLPIDNEKTVSLLKTSILPLCQYYAYIEVGREPEERRRSVEPPSTLWRAYDMILSPKLPMAMRKVRDRRDIYPVFRELFERKSNAATSGV